jgi:four helix bundle protein
LITRFEDIQGWQEARKLVKMIYKLTNSGIFAKDFGLRDQIQRAAVSSTLAPDASAGVTNIAEGFDCDLIANRKQHSRGSWALHGGFQHTLKKLS